MRHGRWIVSAGPDSPDPYCLPDTQGHIACPHCRRAREQEQPTSEPGLGRKVLAVIELDADGTLHFTAVGPSIEVELFDWILSARSRRELTWLPRLHKFQTGALREIVDGARRRTQQLGIYDTLQDSLVHLVTGKKGS